MNDETEAHDGLEQFACSHGINYDSARAAMIPGDADAGWEHLELSREQKNKVERNCIVMWLRLLAERGYPAMQVAA
jgi:hypothetical protein